MLAICADNRTKVQLSALRDTTYTANRQMPRGYAGRLAYATNTALEGAHTLNHLTEAHCDLNAINSSNPMRHTSGGAAARAFVDSTRRSKAIVALILAISFCVVSVCLTDQARKNHHLLIGGL